MGRQLGTFLDEDELDRPDLNKCPDCGCFFAQDECPLCGKTCPEEMRAGNRKPPKKSRKKRTGSDRVVFVDWYHSWWFIILMLFWAGVVIIASTLIRLRYCMAPFFLADRPEDGSTAAVRRSVDMTKGWKWELFKLEVSFWGWDILNFLLSLLVLVPFLAAHVSLLFSLDLNTVNGTLQTIQQVIYDPLPYILSTLVAVPLSLWLEPYRCVSRAGFYDARLQIQQESAPEL